MRVLLVPLYIGTLVVNICITRKAVLTNRHATMAILIARRTHYHYYISQSSHHNSNRERNSGLDTSLNLSTRICIVASVIRVTPDKGAKSNRNGTNYEDSPISERELPSPKDDTVTPPSAHAQQLRGTIHNGPANFGLGNCSRNVRNCDDFYSYLSCASSSQSYSKALPRLVLWRVFTSRSQRWL